MKISILYSLPTRRSLAGPFAETDLDTGESACEVHQALLAKGHQASLLPISEDGLDKITGIEADLIFNLIEWTGLDFPLAKLGWQALEATKIAYTGATWKNYLLTSDKARLKKALDEHCLPTSRWQLFTTGQEPVRPDFNYPLIVKPTLEHCSIGLSKDAIAQNRDNLICIVNTKITQFQQPMVAEEFIDGREFQLTILSGKNGLLVLPPAEIWFEAKGTEAFLSYASRWQENSTEYKTSHLRLPQLPPITKQAFVNLSESVFVKLGFRDYARLDLRLVGDQPVILEVNSNPGLTDSDEYAMTISYQAAGLTFPDFIEAIVTSALHH